MTGRSSWGFRVTFAVSCLILFFLLAPIFIVAPVSLTAERYLSLPTTGVSLRHYIAIFTNEVWLDSLMRSLYVAIVSTVLALLIGGAYSIACWRLGPPWSGPLIGLSLMPIVVPTIVNGVAFFRAWIAFDLTDTYTGVILAHTITSLPYVVIGCSVALANMDRRLEQAARSLGASVWLTARTVIVPNIMPGIVSGGIFAFIHSWDEIVVLLFITGRRVYLLPRAIWDGINDNVDPTIAAIATILVVVTSAALLWNYWRSRRNASTAIENPK